MRTITAVDINLIRLLNVVFFNFICCNNALAFLINSHRPKSIRKIFVGIQKLDNYGGPYTTQASGPSNSNICIVRIDTDIILMISVNAHCNLIIVVLKYIHDYV